MVTADLRRKIELFVSGEDRTLKLANELEVSIDDEFPDHEIMQDLVVTLALYSPVSGPYLYDADHVASRLAAILRHLDK